jgi:hypothetical protein
MDAGSRERHRDVVGVPTETKSARRFAQSGSRCALVARTRRHSTRDQCHVMRLILPWNAITACDCSCSSDGLCCCSLQHISRGSCGLVDARQGVPARQACCTPPQGNAPLCQTQSRLRTRPDTAARGAHSMPTDDLAQRPTPRPKSAAQNRMMPTCPKTVRAASQFSFSFSVGEFNVKTLCE